MSDILEPVAAVECMTCSAAGGSMTIVRGTPKRCRSVAIAAAVVAVLLSPGDVRAAELHVLISGGFAAAYADVVPLYERSSGNRIVTERGPSMGETPQAIPNRLARGEACDVVILVDDALEQLIERGRAVRGSRVDLARSGISMAVRSGAALPDISSGDAFRRTLADAKSIAYSDSASGVHLRDKVFPKIDEDGKIRAKSRMIPAEPVGQVVARGDADLGFQQKSELQPVPGIVVVGPIPDEYQKITVYVAGVAANAAEPDAARDFIRFLSSRDSQAAIIKSGMDPVSALLVRPMPSGEMKNPPKGTEMTKQPVPAGR